jgi:hypothetical protein
LTVVVVVVVVVGNESCHFGKSRWLLLERTYMMVIPIV